MVKVVYAYLKFGGKLRPLHDDGSEYCRKARHLVDLCFPPHLVKFGRGRLVPILTEEQWSKVHRRVLELEVDK